MRGLVLSAVAKLSSMKNKSVGQGLDKHHLELCIWQSLAGFF